MANSTLPEYITFKIATEAVLLSQNFKTFFVSQLWWVTGVLGMLLLKTLKGWQHCISKSNLLI